MTASDLDRTWEHLTIKETYDENGKLTEYGFDGFSVPAGWVILVDKLCLSISSYLLNNPEVPKIKIEQVKSKFAGLRFYYSGGDEVIQRMVSLAEKLSEEMCEYCGSTVDVVKEGSWITNVCKNCKEKNNV